MLTITFTNSAQRLRFKATLRIDALTVPAAISYQRVRARLVPCDASVLFHAAAHCALR